MSSVGILKDIVVLGSIVVAYYFLNSFLKLAGNEYCSKLEKEFRFQVIYTSNILLYRASPGYLDLKLNCLQSRFRTLAYSEPEIY